MATVRLFTYSEMLAASIRPTSNRPITDAIFLLKEPYLANETLTPTTGSAANSALATSPANTRLLKVQVAPSARVHYEITAASQTLRTATTDSPIISGDELFHFGEGYRISLLEAS